MADAAEAAQRAVRLELASAAVAPRAAVSPVPSETTKIGVAVEALSGLAARRGAQRTRRHASLTEPTARAALTRPGAAGTFRDHALRPEGDRAEVAGVLGGASRPSAPSSIRRKPKYYVLDMFPYPSGAGPARRPSRGLHRHRHPRALQAHARLQRAAPDGLGRVRAARRAVRDRDAACTRARPRARNIENFRRQLEALGLPYDWSREIDTTDPRYYRWTQWIFQKLYERGLAYEAEVPVNWCPALGTVLANEEVIDGKSERGGHPVVRLPMRQWMLRITAYADRLLEDLDGLDWPEPIKKMQRDWIGRSEGARVRFPVDGHAGLAIEVFTTRPDTLFGATYMVLAPEHPLVAKITTPERRARGRAPTSSAARAQRARAHGRRAARRPASRRARSRRNPANGARIPIWIADYVLAGYGTGAIMAVPGHDERDSEFARRFGLPIVEVVTGGDVAQQAFAGDGVARELGLPRRPRRRRDAKRRMIEWLEATRRGRARRHLQAARLALQPAALLGRAVPAAPPEDGSVEARAGARAAARAARARRLPADAAASTRRSSARASGSRRAIPRPDAPRAAIATRCRTGRAAAGTTCASATRTTTAALISPEAERYWMPVDLYVGGAEHAVLHLLYARFWHKVLYDLGLVHTKEPFQKLVNQGMILGYSYRYYDDDLPTTRSAQPRVYSRRAGARRGRARRARPTTAAS